MKLSLQEIEKLKVSQTLDLTGEVCPIPTLKTKAALNKLRKGELIKVILASKKSAENIGAEFRDKVYGYCRDGDRFIIILRR
jgi:TusA-related sulfurtransferase